MSNSYTWLKFFHLFGIAAFLFSHGISGGASFALRGSVTAESPKLLVLSQRSTFISNPALLVVIVSGVWMAFAGHWWGQGWLWAALVVLVLVLAAMGYIARPYYMAREAAAKSETSLAERLRSTRPIAALWIGAAGILVLIFLMVFKPF